MLNKILQWLENLVLKLEAKIKEMETYSDESCRHVWNDDGSTCLKCGDKDWMDGEYVDEADTITANNNYTDGQ